VPVNRALRRDGPLRPTAGRGSWRRAIHGPRAGQRPDSWAAAGMTIFAGRRLFQLFVNRLGT
jgi:hypothetical protein